MSQDKQDKQRGLGKIWQSVQSRLRSGKAQIEAGVERKDQERLEDYLAESGQLEGAKAARRRLKSGSAFAGLEKDFRLSQANFKQAAARYGKQSVTTDFAGAQISSQNEYNGMSSAEVDAVGYAARDGARFEQVGSAQGTERIYGRSVDAGRSAAQKLSHISIQGEHTGLSKAATSDNALNDSKGKFSPVKTFLQKLSGKFNRSVQVGNKKEAKKSSLLGDGMQLNSGNAGKLSKVRYNAAAQPSTESPTTQSGGKNDLKSKLAAIMPAALSGVQKRQRKADVASKARKLNAKDLAKVNEDLDSAIIRLQKQERQRRIITVTCFCLSILLVFVFIANIILRQTMAKPELYMLTTGSLDQAFDCFGFVAREEKVLYSPAAGELQAVAAEGSLVAAGQEVANIVVADVSDLKAKKDAIDRQIAEQLLTVLKRGGNLQANQIFTKTDNDMLATINLMRQDVTDNNLSRMDNYLYTLQPMIQERNFALNQLNLHDPVIDNLQSEQNVLNHTLKEQAQLIQTPAAGSISYKINPFGIDINTETIQSMSYEQFINYYNTAKPSVSTLGTVKAQVPIIRLIDTQYQYFLLQVTNAKSSDFEEGKAYQLQLNSQSQPIDNCTVLRVTPDAGGVLILLRSDRKVQNLIDQVAVKGQLIKQTASGLRVPKVALLYEDTNRESTAYLLILKAGFVEKAPVRVLESNEQYAIIDALTADAGINDSTVIVTNPRQVKVGQQVT